MTTLQVASINEKSYINGPGARAVLFLQGCPIHCEGCQNRHLWPVNGGTEMDVEQVAARLLDTGLPVTISGGEPMIQPQGCAELLQVLRLQRQKIHVIVYTGLTIGDLMQMQDPAIDDVLLLSDVLVDGPYVAALDRDHVQWRGSSNQRAIDLNASIWIDSFREQMWLGHLVELDWQVQIVQVTDDGDLVGTAGVMDELFDETVVPTCSHMQVENVT